MITHLVNYPVEVDESDDACGQQGIEFEFMYKQGFSNGSTVTIHIDNCLFHAYVLSCTPFAGCYLFKVIVHESFLLRNLEQIIRIKSSHLQPEEWVFLYGGDFPKE